MRRSEPIPPYMVDTERKTENGKGQKRRTETPRVAISWK
jgi:hypothetical protein